MMGVASQQLMLKACLPPYPILKDLIYFMMDFRELIPLSDTMLIFLMATMEYVLNNNYFMFEGEFFKQIKGVAMGASCAPIYANLVLYMWEKKHVFGSNSPEDWLAYYIYPDNVFILLKSANKIDVFLNYIYSVGDIFLFTGTESENSIDFLDIILFKDETHRRFGSKIFIKKTFSNNHLDHQSNHPGHMKGNTSKGQLTRAARIRPDPDSPPMEANAIRHV